MIDLEELDKQVKNKIKNRKNNELNKHVQKLEWNDFIKYNFCHNNPQSYGPSIEKRVIIKNNFIKTKSNLNEGDCKEENINKEIKSSISTNETFNIVQIRPEAKIKSYILLCIELKENAEVITHVFDVPAMVLNKIPGINSAHGRKKDKKVFEYRVSVKKHNEAWNCLQPFIRNDLVL